RPFLHPDESPKLIALDFFNRYAFDAFRHHVFTLLANGNQQLQNGVTMNASNSLGAANRATLNQMLQHADSLFFRQNHATQRLLFWVAKSLAASQAAITLIAVSVFAELLSGCVACWAVHL